MLVPDADEDALLRDALAFIGDLGVDADATADEEDLLSRLLQDDEPEEQVSSPAVVIDNVPVTGVLAEATVSSSSSDQADQIEPDVSSKRATPGPRKWPGASEGKPTTQNLSRTRRLDEIRYLRDLVGALEKRLAGLHSNDTSEEGTVSLVRVPNELVGAWAQIATRQLEQRHESEMENARLKRLLQDQIQLGKSLERVLLKKRAAIESFESNEAIVKRFRHKNSRSRKSGLEFEELLARCGKQYGETAKVLAKFTDQMSAINHQDVGLVHDPELGLTVELKERRILPFTYEDTASEAWQFLPSEMPSGSVHDYHDLDENEDSLKVQARVTFDVHRARSAFTVNMTRRRYIESDRTVIVMAGTVLPTEISGVKMEGVRMRISGWIIVEPVDSRNATQVTTCHVSVPEVDDELLDHSHQVDTLTEFSLNAMAIELSSRSQQLENRLFQRAFRRK